MNMWIVDEQSLREVLEGLGVQEVKRWHCPCGREACETFVLYGIGHARNESIRVSGPPAEPSARILWVMCSFVFVDDHHNYTCGIDINESVPEMLEHWASGDGPRQKQASLLAVLCHMGLGQELEAELARMRAS